MRSTAVLLVLAALAVPGVSAQPVPLVPPTPLEGSRLGTDVAATADWAAVSASPRFVGDGRFYVFRRSGPGWAFEAEVTGVSPRAGFRGAVAASAECVSAGAPWDNYDVPGGPNAGFHAGSAYVYCRRGGWALDGVLRPSDPVQDGSFGVRVALSGDVAASASVGGYSAPADSMAVYVHRRGGAGWTQEAKLRPGGLPEGASFGAALAASGDLVGASVSVPAGVWERDEAYWVFAYRDGGWGASDTLRVGSGGGAVLAGDRLFLGDPDAPGPEGLRDGVVRVFRREGGRFVLEAALTSDAAVRAQGGHGPDAVDCPFGWVLGATPATLVVAHHCGGSAAPLDTVEVFARAGRSWERTGRSALGLSGAAPRGRRSFALAGDDLVVGLPGSDERASGAGAAYVFPSGSLVTSAGAAPPQAVVVGPYPNPTRGPVTFGLPPGPSPVSVRVVDPLGRTVRAGSATLGGGGGTVRVDLGGLPAGLYTVLLARGGQRWSARVVVAL